MEQKAETKKKHCAIVRTLRPSVVLNELSSHSFAQAMTFCFFHGEMVLVTVIVDTYPQSKHSSDGCFTAYVLLAEVGLAYFASRNKKISEFMGLAEFKSTLTLSLLCLVWSGQENGVGNAICAQLRAVTFLRSLLLSIIADDVSNSLKGSSQAANGQILRLFENQ